MDLSDFEYSNAGESGWTMYLDNSSYISNSMHHDFEENISETKQEHDDDDEDNSSMVSDASSGPPHYCEETMPDKCMQQNTQYWCKSKNKNKKKVHENYIERFNSCLDDTASSILPVGEEVWRHKQHRDSYQRFSDYFQSYSTSKTFKGKLNSEILKQAFSVEKLALDHQSYGDNNQRKRRG